MNAPSQKLHLLPDYREEDPIAPHVACMAMRGVQKQASSTVTRALRGVYAQDAHARQNVLSKIKGS